MSPNMSMGVNQKSMINFSIYVNEPKGLSKCFDGSPDGQFCSDNESALKGNNGDCVSSWSSSSIGEIGIPSHFTSGTYQTRFTPTSNYYKQNHPFKVCIFKLCLQVESLSVLLLFTSQWPVSDDIFLINVQEHS
jgi:hypothetical protein